MQRIISWAVLMNQTETWTIIVQPWQVTDRVLVRVVRTTYTKHGRQRPEAYSDRHVTPAQLAGALGDALDAVAMFNDRWQAAKWEAAQEADIVRVTEDESL